MDSTSLKLAIIAELAKAAKHPRYAGRSLLETMHELSIATLDGFPNDIPAEVISIGQIALQYLDDHVLLAPLDRVSLQRFYSTLPSLQRRALQLHCKGLTFREVATQLRISNEGALSLISKALASMADFAGVPNQQQSLVNALDVLTAPLVGEIAGAPQAPVSIATKRRS